jgi:hypothetical protein
MNAKTIKYIYKQNFFGGISATVSNPTIRSYLKTKYQNSFKPTSADVPV